MFRYPLSPLILALTMLCSTASAQAQAAAVGRFLVKPTYSAAANFSEGLAAVYIEGKWGFIDKSGVIVIPPQFNPGQAKTPPMFSEGLAAVNIEQSEKPGNDTLWGYIDKSGSFALAPRFRFPLGLPLQFQEGLLEYKADKLYGYVDKTGRTVISPRYQLTVGFSEGRAAAQINNKYGAIDRTGAFAIKPAYDNTGFLYEGRMQVCSKGKWGFLDSSGKLVVPLRYDWVSSFNEGFAQVAINRDKTKRSDSYQVRYETWDLWEFGYIDKSGREVIPVGFAMSDYNSVGATFFEGLAVIEIPVKPQARRALFKTKGKFGFIDKAGKLVIPPRFDDAESFSEGLAPVKIGDKYGYIDKTGAVSIGMEFDEAEKFSEGVALVKVNGKFGFLMR